ncbi:MAG TPA: exodeoxyribonuclease III [Solirubrobacteraceae bacterium]|jgi:exodeoxyribonuclease-3|nr:exodeoxyribonuclease III [Solirubrobacteraceae bacterium]
MAQGTDRIRVVSWNVNGIRARWPRLVELLEEQQPDVVCLQETRCPDHRFPYGQLRDLGYEAQHSCGRGGAGVAILVRADHEVDKRSLALDHDHDMAAGRWLQVSLDGLTISSVYVPAGSLEEADDAEAKLAFLEAIARQVYGEQERPLLITGDFNVAPTDQDVYEPEWLIDSSHTGAAERESVREIIAEGELVDVYRRLHPGERGYTCWDQRDGHYARDYGLRIDLALASEHLTPYVTRCDVNHAYRQGRKPSNHAPLEIELEPVA